MWYTWNIIKLTIFARNHPKNLLCCVCASRRYWKSDVQPIPLTHPDFDPWQVIGPRLAWSSLWEMRSVENSHLEHLYKQPVTQLYLFLPFLDTCTFTWCVIFQLKIQAISDQQNNFQPIHSFLLWQDPTHQPFKSSCALSSSTSCAAITVIVNY